MFGEHKEIRCQKTPSDLAVSTFMLLLHFTSVMGTDKGELLPGLETERCPLRHPGASAKGLTLGAGGVLG